MWDFCRLIWWRSSGCSDRDGRSRRAAATFCDVYRQSINERMLAIKRVTTPILGYVCRAIAGRVRSPIAEPDGMWHALRR